MAGGVETHLSRLPDEMLKFVLESSQELAGSRLGRVLCYGHDPIPTPHYVAATSRGVVPHVAQDMLQRHTNIKAVFMGLEDFVEKSARDAPILKLPTHSSDSVLRRYTSLPQTCVSILGARRVPRISCPAQNTNSSISISTSVGFRTLEAHDYDGALETLRPDISTSLVDLIAADKISRKRIEKSADRTHAWLRDTLAHIEDCETATSPLFASIPPLEAEQQQLYLQDLADEYKSNLSGLAMYQTESVAHLPEALSSLPRLCISEPQTPKELLKAVSLGIDLITAPVVTTTSEQGLAFAFTFPPPRDIPSEQQRLNVDMWKPTHAASLKPLIDGCQCYTCTSHHSAYLHHLLQAKEMLAWTLLQLHNFHMLDQFFAGIRKSIKLNTFETESKRFEQYYEDEFLPGEGKDRGPRIRGYQMKSSGADPKKNEKKWGRFEDGAPAETTAGLKEAVVQEAAMNEEIDTDACKLGLPEQAETPEE